MNILDFLETLEDEINEYDLDFDNIDQKCCDLISIDEKALNEAKYQGKEVTLNKPMKGDIKKFKVYVKNDEGNIVKVNFGSPGMEIRRDNPARRKSFRARHRCTDPGPKWKARYWSCKMWQAKVSVTDMLKK